VAIQIADLPEDEMLDELGLESPFDLLGYSGVSASRKAATPALLQTGQMPNMVWLFRRPLLDYWAEHDETLGHLITHVLVHEIGHHFGLSTRTWSASRPQPRRTRRHADLCPIRRSAATNSNRIG
jgi:predicted Zn-dependent protease with MMP-like domain